MKINVDFNVYTDPSSAFDFEKAESLFNSNPRAIKGRLWRQTILISNNKPIEGRLVNINISGNMGHNSPIKQLTFELIRYYNDEAIYALKKVHYMENHNNPIPGPGSNCEVREANEE